MPTKDIDLGLVRSILFSYVQKVNSSNVLWILPYIYELSIVLLCARARNVCSHNIYDTKSVHAAVLFNSFPVKKGEHI